MIIVENSIFQPNEFFALHSTRKQKAREKRSRQSDVMSDIESIDVMLGIFPEYDFERQKIAGDIEADLESDRLCREKYQAGECFRPLLNTNTFESSEITTESNRAIDSENSSQTSRKPEKVRINLNAHVREAINSAIEEKYCQPFKLH